MKTIIQIVLFCLLLTAPLKAEEVRVGAAVMGGLIELDQNGKACGPLLDWWETVMAPALNADIKWYVMPLNRLTVDLENGDIHLLLTLMKNPEREKIALYPSQPSWVSRVPLIVKKESPLKKRVR